MTPDEARVILGLSVGASVEEVEKAYRLRARMMHPDRFVGSPDSEIRLASAEFRRVSDARLVLVAANGTKDTNTPPPERGADVEVVSIVNALFVERGGTARISTPGGRTINVRVPPGIRTGGRLRVRGQGAPGLRGGETGDLIVILNVEAAEQDYAADRDENARAMTEAMNAIRHPVYAPGNASANESFGRAGMLRRGLIISGLVLLTGIVLVATSTALRDTNSEPSGADLTVPRSIGFSVANSDDMVCGDSQTDGCWTWRIIPESSCARAVATIVLSESSSGEIVMTRQNDLSDLRKGVPLDFTTPASSAGPEYADIESVVCE